MGNTNRNCQWPNCSCKIEYSYPCKFEDPDFYINKKDKEVKTYTFTITDKQLDILIRMLEVFPDAFLNKSHHEDLDELKNKVKEYDKLRKTGV